MDWIKALLSNKSIEKEAELTNQHTEWARKVKSNDWIKDTLSIDEEQVSKEASLQQKADEEVRGLEAGDEEEKDENPKLKEYFEKVKNEKDPEKRKQLREQFFEKTAAYVVGDDQAETIKNDYELCVSGISNYHLAETLAEHILSPKGLATDPKEFSEEKAKQLKAVESDRKAAEKKLLGLIGEHTAVDWKKKFEEFKKDKVEHADGKELYAPEFEAGKQNWEKKEDWDKAPSDKERIEGMHGVGGEEKKNAIGDEKLLEEQRKEASLDKKAGTMPTTTESLSPAVVREEYPNALLAEPNKKVVEFAEKNNRQVDVTYVDAPWGKTVVRMDLTEYLPSPTQPMEGSKKEDLTKVAYRKGDKVFYRGKPALVKDIWMNPHSMEAIVVVDDGDGRDLPIQDKELKQLSKEPLHERDLEHVEEPKKEDPSNRLLQEEIAPKASKADVLKKIAEVKSPWEVIKDEHGIEQIAKTEQTTTTKESEEDKENLTSEGK